MIVTNYRNGLEDLGTRWCWTDSTKKPKGLDGTCLKVNEPQDWMTFDDALAKTSETPGRTLGLLMNPDDDLVCIDLDDCLDERGNIKDLAVRALVDMADSYTEVSMGGRGLHLFIRSELMPKVPTKGSPEIYDGKHARYIAVTGKYYEGFRTVRTSDEALKKAIELNGTLANQKAPKVKSSVLDSDSQTIQVQSKQAAVRLALRELSEDRCDDRSEWFNVLCSIKSTLGEGGWELFDKWSQNSDAYDEAENTYQWDSVVDPEATLGTLLKMAHEDSGILIRVPQEDASEGEMLMRLLEENLYSINDIPDELEVEWLVKGIIAKGHHTLISGREKSGKSTLIGGMLKALTHPDGGKFLDIEVEGNKKIMVLSEESQTQWKIRKRTHNINGTIDITSNMFAKQSRQGWKTFCHYLAKKLRRENYDLLVIDPLAYFAPWRDENSSTEVTESMIPLDAFKGAGIALLSCHHGSKSSGQARGSTAITSMPDINLNLSYPRKKVDNYETDDLDTSNRFLRGQGRFTEVEKSIKLSFNPLTETYERRLSNQEEAKINSQSKVIEVIRESLEPISKNEISESLETPIPEPTLRRYLKGMEESGELIQSGSGTPSDPYKYIINKDHGLDSFI